LLSQASTSSALLDTKIEETAAGLPASFAKRLHSISNEGNAAIIVQYIAAMKSEVNMSDHYRRDIIVMLCKFSKFSNNKPFKDVIRADLFRFLDSFRKPESVDPLHKWIGTYNIYREHFLRFFKWLHYPDIEPAQRPKPSVIDNMPRLKRKEKSVYKPSDLWTQVVETYFPGTNSDNVTSSSVTLGS
jgi:hypothetical protein